MGLAGMTTAELEDHQFLVRFIRESDKQSKLLDRAYFRRVFADAPCECRGLNKQECCEDFKIDGGLWWVNT